MVQTEEGQGVEGEATAPEEDAGARRTLVARRGQGGWVAA